MCSCYGEREQARSGTSVDEREREWEGGGEKLPEGTIVIQRCQWGPEIEWEQVGRLKVGWVGAVGILYPGCHCPPRLQGEVRMVEDE